MKPQDLTERLIHARQEVETAARNHRAGRISMNSARAVAWAYDDELHTAAALLRTVGDNQLAHILDLLVTELAAARDADNEAQAQRRGLA